MADFDMIYLGNEPIGASLKTSKGVIEVYFEDEYVGISTPKYNKPLKVTMRNDKMMCEVSIMHGGA